MPARLKPSSHRAAAVAKRSESGTPMVVKSVRAHRPRLRVRGPITSPSHIHHGEASERRSAGKRSERRFLADIRALKLRLKEKEAGPVTE